MEQIRIDQLISGDAGKDAIHIAIAPVIASETLLPGAKIGFVEKDNFELVGKVPNPIGIVSPWLPHHVKKGQKFYMLLNPYTITSLRHEWEHPAFKGDYKVPGKSEMWLLNWANELGMTYQALMDAAQKYIKDGSYYCLGHETPDQCFYEIEDFWRHYEIVSGQKVKEQDKNSFFHCAC